MPRYACQVMKGEERWQKNFCGNHKTYRWSNINEHCGRLSLPKTSYFLISLTLFQAPRKIPSHENYPLSRSLYPARPTAQPHPFAPWNPVPSPTTCHGKTQITQTDSILLAWAVFLGLALPSMARLPKDTSRFQTRYSGALAPKGLSAVLDPEMPVPPERTTTRGSKGTRAHPDDVPR